MAQFGSTYAAYSEKTALVTPSKLLGKLFGHSKLFIITGDCDVDSHCKTGLTCGKDNCPTALGWPTWVDCCEKGSATPAPPNPGPKLGMLSHKKSLNNNKFGLKQ